jgi:uncharacterized protein YjbI with pentapeptide repeats
MITIEDIPDEIWLIIFKYIDFVSLYKLYELDYFKPLIKKEYKYIIKKNFTEEKIIFYTMYYHKNKETRIYTITTFKQFINKLKSEYIKYLYKNNRRNFSNMDLSSLDLSYFYFKNVNLENTNLSYTNLSFTNLENSNLSNCDLNQTELNYTNLYKCKIKNVTNFYFNETIINQKILL